MTAWETTLVAIGIALGVLGVYVGRLIDRGLHRRSSESPAGEFEGWTRRTWPGAPRADTTEGDR